MGFFKDTMAMFKKRELVFLESYKESDDVYTFLFEKNQDSTWNPGQYGLFSITHKKIKNAVRPFSIASAPTEQTIKITTIIGDDPSEFKKAMLELKKGMKMSMQGPVGSFYANDNKPSLLIACGIGITPFRSIIKQIEAEGNELKNPIHLLYIDNKKSFVYKGEIDAITERTSINTTYLDSMDDLHQAINKLTDIYKSDGKYYIAGTKTIVESVSVYLRNNHISKGNIKKDVFSGY